MYYLTPFTFISLAISAVTALLVSSEHHHHKSAPADPSSTAASDYTDHTDGFATWYNQSNHPGACGQTHSDYDLICALQTKTYKRGPYCGKQIKITNTDNRRSVTVTVADKCPGCRNVQSIDLSVGAFEKIGDLSKGVLPITWHFV